MEGRERAFRRYLDCYGEVGLQGLNDQRLVGGTRFDRKVTKRLRVEIIPRSTRPKHEAFRVCLGYLLGSLTEGTGADGYHRRE